MHRSKLGSTIAPASSSLVDGMAQAIAKMEGFYNPTSNYSQVNNNPGNLRFNNQPGATQGTGGFAYFANPQDGWNALYSQIQYNINKGLTMEEFFGGKAGVYPGYAPAADSNSPNQYAAFVAQQVGVPVDTTLSQLQGTFDAGQGAGDVVAEDTSSSPSGTTLAIIAGIAAFLGFKFFA